MESILLQRQLVAAVLRHLALGNGESHLQQLVLHATEALLFRITRDAVELRAQLAVRVVIGVVRVDQSFVANVEQALHYFRFVIGARLLTVQAEQVRR